MHRSVQCLTPGEVLLAVVMLAALKNSDILQPVPINIAYVD